MRTLIINVDVKQIKPEMFNMQKRRFAIALILVLIATAFFTTIPQRSNAADNATLRLVPSTTELTSSMVGQTITVNLTIQNVQKLWQWAAELTWDPTVLNFTKLEEGPFLSSIGSTIFPFAADEATRNGHIREVSSTLMSTSTANGSGLLMTITYKVVSAKATEITLNVTSLKEPSDPNAADPYNPPIAHTDYGTTLTSSSATPTPTTSPSPTILPTETPSANSSPSPTVTTLPTNLPSSTASQSQTTTTSTNDSSSGGISNEILIIVGAGAVVAVVIGIGAWVQRKKP
jgi:hypothetical protein